MDEGPEVTTTVKQVKLTLAEKEQIKSAEKNIIAGGVAGSFAKTMTAPLARLTVLYQVSSMFKQNPKSAAIKVEDSLWKSFMGIIRKEGFLSLWKGNFTAVIHRFPYSAINFASFEAAKSYLSPNKDNRDSSLVRLACGAISGGVSCFACYPLDLVRVRLTLGAEQAKQSAGPQVGRFRMSSTIVTTLLTILEKDGALGLYRGLSASLIVAIPQYALSFSIYGKTKEILLDTGGIWVNNHGHITSYGALLCGSITGICVSSILFPLDVIRKRMQVSSSPKMQPSSAMREIKATHSSGGGGSSKEALSKTSMDTLNKFMDSVQQTRNNLGNRGLIYHTQSVYVNDGIRGFYRGLTPELLKVCPMVALTFCSYEFTKELLDDYFP